MAEPKKQLLGLFDFTLIVVSLVIGMGIFRTPANVAAAVPNPFIFFMVWLVGGLVALCGALTFAEIGSRLPVMGGYYKVFSYAYHPSIAFAVNCLILVSHASTLAGISLIGGEYITGVFIPELKDPEYLKAAANAQSIQTLRIIIAISAIIIFYGVNLLGLKMSARTQSVLVLIKIILVLLLISLIFFSINQNSVDQSVVNPGFREYLKAFGVGLVAVSFTYAGYEQTINFGAEINKPTRNIPRGIFLAIFIIIALYLTINYAYISTIGFDTLKSNSNIAALMALEVFGVHAERILSVFLFLSVLATVNVLLMSSPRMMYAMSEDRILPKSFQKRSRRTGTLVVSLSAFAVLCAIVVFWAKEFDTILSFSIFIGSFGMMLSGGSIFILRGKTAHLNNSGIYTMKWYPLQPLIFIAGYGFVAISLFINETKLSLIGLCVFAAFIFIYFIIQFFQYKK
jgi:APA family basic amino acid/polyamine antiporter